MEQHADKIFDRITADRFNNTPITIQLDARHYFRLGFIERGNWDEEQLEMSRDHQEELNQNEALIRGEG